jgi:CRP/FNR family transcriptional regulator, cyclic AMP receptor protein
MSNEVPALSQPASRSHESLLRIGLFRSLDPGEIEMLGRRCRWRQARAGEWLYELDDQGTDVFFLTKGSVRVLIRRSSDRGIILTDIDAGGYFGELAAIDGQPRSAGILALTNATIACMPASVFLESVHKHADVREQLLRLLVSRVRALTQRVNEFSSMHVKHRIYAELLRRSRADSTDPHRAIVSPPPVHSDLAARVSTRREMVARELKALERAGLLAKRRGALVITSVSELVQQIQTASE